MNYNEALFFPFSICSLDDFWSDFAALFTKSDANFECNFLPEQLSMSAIL